MANCNEPADLKLPVTVLWCWFACVRSTTCITSYPGLNSCMWQRTTTAKSSATFWPRC